MNIGSMPQSYDALVVVSPMHFGEDQKDQDRARWCGPRQIACDCDGVTSSPYSAEAATLAASLVPLIFDGDVHERLKMLCDGLMLRRHECQEAPIVPAEGTPPAMQQLLTQIVREKREAAFQTTLVAAKFGVEGQTVTAHVLKCGDSAFFAFDPEGQLLSSSLAYPLSPHSDDKPSSPSLDSPARTQSVRFGPGDEILVRVEGRLSEYAHWQRWAGIRLEHAGNWLVCVPVDACPDEESSCQAHLADLQSLLLKPGDMLLVPEFLWGKSLRSAGRQYRVLRYSSTIRPLHLPQSAASINDLVKHGSTTDVLPDHFYCGCFNLFEDRFPLQTHFLLCSDGFYGGFSHWEQAWTWLQNHAAALRHEEARTAVLEQLHASLYAKSGDDDISFVWVYPARQGSPGTDATEVEEGGDSCRPK